MCRVIIFKALVSSLFPCGGFDRLRPGWSAMHVQ